MLENETLEQRCIHAIITNQLMLDHCCELKNISGWILVLQIYDSYYRIEYNHCATKKGVLRLVIYICKLFIRKEGKTRLMHCSVSSTSKKIFAT